MKITEEVLKNNFAANLAELRKQSGMTQLELAEKLSYSDKSISKWERGDGLPDLFVATKLSELFNVTVDELIGEKEPHKPFIFRNKVITTILSISIAWLAALVLFFLFRILLPQISAWLFFVYALPASAIVAIVLSCVWWNKLCRLISVSALIWSLPLCIVVTLPIPGIWLIFTIAAALQIMTFLWFLMRR